jgi:YHS domain-containing protein/mono/diheme cytochrome c family protein
MKLSGTEPGRAGPESGENSGPARSGSGDAVARGLATCQSMGCLACHSQSRIAPPLGSLYNSQVRLDDHRTVWADEAYLHESIVDPNAKIVAGYLPTMPSYRTLLSDQQLGDVLSYLKSLSDNPPGGHGVVAKPTTAPSSDELIVTDPVCKMQVRADPSAPQEKFEGKTFFFCSQQCRDRFLKDPKHFCSTSNPRPGP